MLRLREDRYTTPGTDELLRQMWFAEAELGRVWVPNFVSDAWAQLIRMALYRMRDRQEVTLLIDCEEGGDKCSFNPCIELWWRRQSGLTTTTIVLANAYSIGLSYSVCATMRLAYPDATFMAHGESRRQGPRNEDGMFAEDRYMVNWLARFTKRSEAEWLEYAGDGACHEFGVAEALEWGVIDEVLEGV